MSSSLSEFSCDLGVALEVVVATTLAKTVEDDVVVTDNGAVGRVTVEGLNLCIKFVPDVGVL